MPVTEGETDVSLLGLRFPELSRATVRAAGGRARVLKQVEQLAPYDLPVLGVVDKDVLASAMPGEVASDIVEWPTADIEGVFLSDDKALQVMLDNGLMKNRFGAVAELRALLDQLCEAQKDNVIAELAQRKLRETAVYEWPTPRGDQPLRRLREAITKFSSLSTTNVEAAITEAEAVWNGAADHRWTLVRGKYVINAFASTASEMKSGQALLEAVARSSVNLVGFTELAVRLKTMF